MKHTKGPWEVTANCDVRQTNAHRHDMSVAQVFGVKTNAETQANARLIAAAPALYEACKMLMGSIGCGGNGGEHNANCHMRFSTYPPADCTCGVRLAKAAIAKAEGKP